LTKAQLEASLAEKKVASILNPCSCQPCLIER
jgi:hypothetical protein